MSKLNKVVKVISRPWHYDSLFIKVKQSEDKIYYNVVRREGNTLAEIEFNKVNDTIKDFTNIVNSVSAYRSKNNCLRVRVFVEDYDNISPLLEEEMKLKVQKLDDKLVEFFDLSKMNEIVKDFTTVIDVLKNDK